MKFFKRKQLLFLLLTGFIAQAQENNIVINEAETDVVPNLIDNLPPGEVLIEEENQQNQEVTFEVEIDPREEIFLQQLTALNLNQEQEALLSFYKNHDFQAQWSEEQINYFLANLVQFTENHALPANAYFPNLQEKSAWERDLFVSASFLKLARHLSDGLVDAKKTQAEWNVPPASSEELANSLQEALQTDIFKALTNINSGNHWYQRLQEEYKSIIANNLELEEQYQRLSEEALPEIYRLETTKSLRLGDDEPDVYTLRKMLGLSSESMYFDEELQLAVQEFQRQNGLKADRVVGRGTRQALNRLFSEPLKKREQDLKNIKKALDSNNNSLNSLKINMERLRWMPQEIGDYYVLVNIPNYNVEMYRFGQKIYESSAVVGRKNRQTPAFVDRLRHIVMSPTWTVPPTILKKDKLPQLINNPGAFDANFDAVGGGRTRKPSEVNWASESNRYTLRQKPGASNALGKVKFLFPNKHAIYLHDTPNKKLFKKTYRAESSGCVRISKPEEFAQILLSNSSWNNSKIKNAMNQTKEVWAKPTVEVPIYLVYWTQWSNGEGKIQSAKDVYDKDGKLLRQYEQAFANYQALTLSNKD